MKVTKKEFESIQEEIDNKQTLSVAQIFGSCAECGGNRLEFHSEDYFKTYKTYCRDCGHEEDNNA